MQELFEENKVLKKAVIIASSALLEAEGKLKKIKEENAELKKTVPQFLHTKVDMPLLLNAMQEKLLELRQAVVINKNIKMTLLPQVQDLRETFATKDKDLKILKKKNQLDKKGSYSKISMIKRTGTLPVNPNHNRKNKSESNFFG